MASLLLLKHPRMSVMPSPPTIFSRENTRIHTHDQQFTMKILNPFNVPMMLRRLQSTKGNALAQDSWEERHFQHCQEILQEISHCEEKVIELRNKEIEDSLHIKLIEEIDDDEFWWEDSDHSSTLSDEVEGATGTVTSQSQDEPETPALPEIPINILRSVLAPLIRDRSTLNNLAATCKELQRTCLSMDPPPPWPEGLLRLGSGIWSIAFSPDGNLLAVGSRDGSIRLFDRRKGILPPLTEHVARVYSIVFHPNSYIMASGSGDGEVRIWDLRNTEDPPRTLATNSTHIDCLAFNHDGSILASSGDGRIRLWNIQDHRCLGEFSDGSHVAESIAFSPNGRWIAAGNWGHRVVIWDVLTWNVTFSPESTIVHAICWSPDSRHLCSAGDSRNLRLWNVADQTYTSLEGHRDSVWCVDFSPDGRFIASGSDDGTVRIFSTESGRCTAILDGHDDGATVYGVAFSPCNKFVASAGDDGCIDIRRTS